MNRLLGLALVLILSTSALAQSWDAFLLGTTENPPNASPATGDSAVVITGDTLAIDVIFSGLVGGPATAAHIHCCATQPTNAGVAIGMTGFPTSTSGVYSNVFDLSNPATYSSSFLSSTGGTAAGAKAALVAGMNAGNMSYFNIHNATFPGGEIRGYYAPVPEPASLWLLVIGVAAPLLARRRNRR